MKIKKLIVLKEECENKIECLELALGYVSEWDSSKITLTPEQARDIHDLLVECRKLLNMVIDSAEVDIG